MSDAAVETWLAHVLEVREERLSTVTGTGKRQSYGWYDNTSPLIRGGEVVTNGCPLERERGLALGLFYEWGPEQQDAFVQTMGPHLDLVRWDGVVAELGTHWVNSAPQWGEGAIRELEALAPGMQPVLHDLGKTSLFRGLRQYPLGMYDAVLAPGERSPLEVPIRIGDSRVRDQAPERSEYRSARIAARGMAEWFSRRYDAVPMWSAQECVVCGLEYWPQALDASDLARIGSPRYCHLCVAMTRRDPWALHPPREDDLRRTLIDIIHAFLDITGVFPFQGVTAAPIAGLPDTERDMMVRMLLVMPTMDTVKPLFGSWREFLNVAGMLDQAPRKGLSGYITVANDGHVTLSIGERIVCDWLLAHGIAHEKEPIYPTHPVLNAEGKLRADWLIGDCWVELAGRMEDAKYAANMLRKQQLARECGLRHLVLLPAEIHNLSAIAIKHWIVTSAF